MHVHIGGIQQAVNILAVIVVLGTLNLLAMKYQKKSSLAAAWANLFGVS